LTEPEAPGLRDRAELENRGAGTFTAQEAESRTCLDDAGRLAALKSDVRRYGKMIGTSVFVPETTVMVAV